MVITLIGYRGSGKSTVGRLLATRLGWRFADADNEIERRAGCTIREIFQSEGEPQFRALEQQVMADLLNQDRWVIAAGGGAILAAETRDRLKSAGPVVYLAVSVDTALARIEADATTAARRPALTHLPPREEITEVLAARVPLYRASATIELDADHQTAAELAAAIVDRLPQSIAPHRETAT